MKVQKQEDEVVLMDDFSRQTAIPRSYQEDVVDGLYKIHLTEAIEELGNEFCKYYRATSIEGTTEYFAIVFEKQFNPQINVLQALKTMQVPGLNNLLAYSIVKLSQQKSYSLVAIIDKYEHSATLAKYIEKNGPLSVEQIEKKLVPLMTELLNKCEILNISCGNINPDNIIVLDNENFLLREFICAYPSFYQSNSYLAPELVECGEFGRQMLSVAADIYALGVTIFYALTGKHADKNYDNNLKYNQDRLETTTFKLLIEKRKISEHFRIFFRGVMQDNAFLRWKIRNIVEWFSGKAPKTLIYEKINENVSPIGFNENHYNNLKSLAYALFYNWEEGLKFIQEDKLLKWISRSQHQVSDSIVERAQQLLKITESARPFVGMNNVDRSNKLTQLLSIIDPTGPVRERGLAFSATSIPNALHYLLVKNKKMLADVTLKAIVEKYYIIGEDKNSASIVDHKVGALYENASKYFLSTQPACGLERVVYTLNPYAHCLSNMVLDDYVITLADLMMSLEKVATQSPERLSIDRHIVAFIAAKINLKQAADLKILKNFPKFSEHPLIYGLSILSVAQAHEPEIKIPNICNVIAKKIIDLFNDSLHNVKFKNQMIEKITEVSKSGTLSEIINLLSDATPFINDYNGYYNACRELESLKYNMHSLNHKDKIFEDSLTLGQKLTVLMSYILCFVVTVILIM